jgi:hypothetical protein
LLEEHHPHLRWEAGEAWVVQGGQPSLWLFAIPGPLCRVTST